MKLPIIFSRLPCLVVCATAPGLAAASANELSAIALGQRARAELLREGVSLERLGWELSVSPESGGERSGRWRVTLRDTYRGERSRERLLERLPEDPDAAAAEIVIVVTAMVQRAESPHEAALLAYASRRASLKAKGRGQRRIQYVSISGKKLNDWQFTNALAEISDQEPPPQMRTLYAPDNPRKRGLMIAGYAVGGGVAIQGAGLLGAGYLYRALYCSEAPEEKYQSTWDNLCKSGRGLRTAGTVMVPVGLVLLGVTAVYHGMTDPPASRKPYYSNDARKLLVQRYNRLLRQELQLPESVEAELEPIEPPEHELDARRGKSPASSVPAFAVSANGFGLSWSF